MNKVVSRQIAERRQGAPGVSTPGVLPHASRRHEKGEPHDRLPSSFIRTLNSPTSNSGGATCTP